MLVTFQDVHITSIYTGISSKTGNPYGFLSFFLPASNEMFEIPLFGEDVQALEGIQPNSTVSKISFSLAPARRGGVELKPAW